MDDMRRLNPGLKRHATPPNGQLVIPVDVAEKFAAQLANLDYDNRTSPATPSEPKASSPAIAANTTSAVPPQNRQTLRYTVRRGDSLIQISRRYRVSVSDLRAWNDLESSQYLQPGQKLTLFVDTRMRADGSDG
jgi:membrane-bound lytic murein transglycosylase D